MQCLISVNTLFKEFLQKREKNQIFFYRNQLSVGSTLVAGGLAGMCNWLVAIPMDVVKSRLQAAPEGTYTGARDVLTKLLSQEGPRALWKGAVPVLMRWN